MRIRRKVLIAIALLVGLADAAYVLRLRLNRRDDMEVAWIAHIPSLEQKQIHSTLRLISTWDFHDPEYPPLYTLENGFFYTVWAKIASDCRVSQYMIDDYVFTDRRREIVQMPERLFIGDMDSIATKCIRRSLPKGYVLSKLERPLPPRMIGWGFEKSSSMQPTK